MASSSNTTTSWVAGFLVTVVTVCTKAWPAGESTRASCRATGLSRPSRVSRHASQRGCAGTSMGNSSGTVRRKPTRKALRRWPRDHRPSRVSLSMSPGCSTSSTDLIMSRGSSSKGRNSTRNSARILPMLPSTTACFSSMRRALSALGMAHQARRASSSVRPAACTTATTASGSPSFSSRSRLSSLAWPMRVQRRRKMG